MLPLPSTMSDYQLTIGSIFEHGVRVHAESEVLTWMGDNARRATFHELGDRVRRLASALQRLGIRPGDRVGTFCWNHQEHLEAYYAISSMGAVVHTLNIRLFPEQLTYVINHGEDRIIVVDASLYAALANILKDLRTVEQIIVVGDAPGLPSDILRYEEVLATEPPEFTWPDLDERSAAVMCNTTGTTGDPKGVVYSHRSIYLHALTICASWGIGISINDRVLSIVPMFHANAWGIPYAGWLAGSDLLMPGPYLQPELLCRFITTCRPTVSAAIPTILAGALHYAVANKTDLSMFRILFSGGAALPRSIAEGFRKHFNVPIVQGWGMTETSPVAAVAQPPRDCPPGEEITSPPGPAVSSRALKCASATATRFCPGMTNRSEKSKYEARGSQLPTTAILHPNVFATAGSAPATWASSTSAATCASPTAPRTSSNPAVSGYRRSNWRTPSPTILTSSKLRSSAYQMSAGTSARCLCRQQIWRAYQHRRASCASRFARRQVVDPGAVGLHPRGSQNQRRQIRQESASCQIRQRIAQ